MNEAPRKLKGQRTCISDVYERRINCYLEATPAVFVLWNQQRTMNLNRLLKNVATIYLTICYIQYHVHSRCILSTLKYHRSCGRFLIRLTIQWKKWKNPRIKSLSSEKIILWPGSRARQFYYSMWIFKNQLTLLFVAATIIKSKIIAITLSALFCNRNTTGRK